MNKPKRFPFWCRMLAREFTSEDEALRDLDFQKMLRDHYDPVAGPHHIPGV